MKFVIPMRKIDLLAYKRAKIYSTDGKIYIGTGDCVCDISDDEHPDLEGLCFDSDDGEGYIFAEDDIERYEILDDKERPE